MFLSDFRPVSNPPPYQERAWYDSHRASLVPEADVDTVLDGVRRGAPPPRGKDRGLTASHLQAFINPRIWKTFEGDGENVLYMFLQFLNWSAYITCRSASSPFIETFSLGSRTMNRSGLVSLKSTFLVLETTNPHGPNQTAALKFAHSTQGGSNSPHRKTFLGSISGISRTLQTAGQEGAHGGTYLPTCPVLTQA